jgi:hypothetical protein
MGSLMNSGGVVDLLEPWAMPVGQVYYFILDCVDC